GRLISPQGMGHRIGEGPPIRARDLGPGAPRQRKAKHPDLSWVANCPGFPYRQGDEAAAPGSQGWPFRPAVSAQLQKSHRETTAEPDILSIAKAERERSLAVFIDLENLAIGFQNQRKIKFDIAKVLERLVEKGKLIVKKAYADWSRYPSYTAPFHESAI